MTKRPAAHHGPDPKVHDNKDDRRFELAINGHVAFLDYERAGRELRLLHTEVPSALQGRGLATHLIRHAIDTAKHEKRQIVSMCSAVDNYLAKHGIG